MRRHISNDAKVILLNTHFLPEVGVGLKEKHQLAAVSALAQFLHLQIDHVVKHVFISVTDHGQHMWVVHNSLTQKSGMPWMMVFL